MNGHYPKALIATADSGHRRAIAEVLLNLDCDIHTASRVNDGLDLLRKQRYDLVVVDEQLDEMSPLEFSMNLRDLARPMPAVLVSGANGQQERLEKLGVAFSGKLDELLENLPATVRQARQRFQ